MERTDGGDTIAYVPVPKDLTHVKTKFLFNLTKRQGLLFYGSTILPFVDRFPKDTLLYRLMTTKLLETMKENTE